MEQALILRHVPFEDAGAIVPWLEERGLSPHELRLWENTPLPEQPPDWLIIMGGPMSIQDETQHPWLPREKAFIRRCIDAGTTIVGVCLGAQLLAEALGARVQSGEPEIGWFPVRPAGDHPLARHFMDETPVLHWHSDRFDIPQGAVHLLASDACPGQAFLYGDRILGLQFHLEMDEPGLDTLSRECAEELDTGRRWIQNRETLLRRAGWHGRECRDRLHALLNNLAGLRKADPGPNL